MKNGRNYKTKKNTVNPVYSKIYHCKLIVNLQ